MVFNFRAVHEIAPRTDLVAAAIVGRVRLRPLKPARHYPEQPLTLK
ncbi:MAG TPA: hypothetical protein PK580_04730 [Nitrosomonas halophila]|nr:hypothetical protein [Nitrosomonas halophila]